MNLNNMKLTENIDHQYNYDSIFFRMVTISLLKTLHSRIRWINYFKDKKFRVVVPFYSPLANGDNNFMLDAFVDDTVDKRVELNTDQIPRGVATLTSYNPVSEEFANPNQYIAKKTNINDEMRKIISKVKAVPIKLNYSLELILASELDVYKCSEKILNCFYNYFYFSVDYCGLKLDAVLTLPDDKEIKIPREISLTNSDRKKQITINIVVSTYYPLFMVDTDDLEVCDNDNDINWDRLGVKRPSVEWNYENVLKIGAAKKTFYYAFGYEMKQYPVDTPKTKSEIQKKKDDDLFKQ